MDFESILRGVLTNAAEEAGLKKGAQLPEAIRARIEESAARFMAPNPFNVGDWVTPRTGTIIQSDQVGNPMMVVALLDGVKFAGDSSPSTMLCARYSNPVDSVFFSSGHHADYELLADYEARQHAKQTDSAGSMSAPAPHAEPDDIRGHA